MSTAIKVNALLSLILDKVTCQRQIENLDKKLSMDIGLMF